MQPIRLEGLISVIFDIVKSHYGIISVREMYSSILYNMVVTKQWTTKWLYIANALFRIV